MALPSPPPPLLYPCQLRCYNCGAIFTMPPAGAADTFFCSNCDFCQILRIPSPSSNPNGGSLPTVHGIDPYKMQVVCTHCLAILNLPPHGLSTHFVCPLCHFHPPFFTFPVSSSSPPAQQPHKVLEIADDSDSKNATTSSMPKAEEETLRSIFLLKDRKRIRAFEKVEDCFILDFDPYVTDDSDSKNATSSMPTAEEETLRSIFLLKDRKRTRVFEKVEDCFILDFDPYGLSSRTELIDDHDHDVVLLPEQSQVPCRDYPHQRYLCAKHPFSKTAHDVHCKMCYCCVCDVPAPCKKWIKGDNFRHCDASVDTPIYERFRNQKRRRTYPQ